MKGIIHVFLLSVLVSSFVFADLDSNMLNVAQGDWSFSQDGDFVISNSNDLDIVLFEEYLHLGDTVVSFDVSSNSLSAGSRAFLIFDYNSVNDFKYAGLRVDDDQFVIGHYDGTFKDSIQENANIDEGEVYSFEVEIDGNEVVIIVDGQSQVSRDFPTKLNGILGFGAVGSQFRFEDLDIVSTVVSYSSRLNLDGDLSATDTGLDYMISIIENDPGLIANIPNVDILEAMYYGNEMNMIILESIIQTNIAIDSELSISDIKILNNYINENYFEAWYDAHGDDEDGEEIGYHLVQNDGASTQIFGKNAVNTVIDGIFHLGFPPANDDQIQNEDGNANARFSDIAYWLSEFLAEDLFGTALVGNLEEADVNLVMDDEFEGDFIEFGVSIENEIFDFREVRIKPSLICDGVQNTLRTNGGFLSSSALSSQASDLESFTFRLDINDLMFRVPRDEKCLFVVQLEDEFRTDLYLVEDVWFLGDVLDEKKVSISGTSIDVVSYMQSVLLNEIRRGFNDVEFVVVNNKNESEDFSVSLIVSDLGIEYISRISVQGDAEQSISIPVFIGKEVQEGLYPARIAVGNGEDKIVKYSYLNVG